MAAKQEERPSTVQRSTRTLTTLGPASQWGAHELDLLQVRFEKDEFDKLPDVVLEFTPDTNVLRGENVTDRVDERLLEDERKHRPDNC
jgi:hypothetical protein